MQSSEMLYLSRRDVESVKLPMSEIISALEQMFVEKGHSRVEMPPKPGIHPLPDAFVHAMPAYIPAMKSAGIKWVSGYPQNQARGIPYINGLMILNDPATGIPIAVMDCTWVTAMRTGAATAVAAKILARPESSTLGVLACGVQGRSNLIALDCAFDLRKVYAFDVVPDVARRFADEMSRELNLEIEIVRRPEDAVRKMDLVVTSGPILKNPTPSISIHTGQGPHYAKSIDLRPMISRR
jgi:ornithine cyclodeaminase/alanine dehydrogenase-like protein (mu-crystallin family)